MQIVLLLLTLAALLVTESAPSQPINHAGRNVGLIFMLVILPSMVAAIVTWQSVRAIQRPLANHRWILQRYTRWRSFVFIGWATCSILIYWQLNWGQIVRFNGRLNHVPLMEELALLLPLVLPYLLIQCVFYEFERVIRNTASHRSGRNLKTWTRLGFLRIQLTQHLALVLFPLLALLTLEDVLRLIAPDLLQSNWGGFLLLIPVGGLIVGFPWLLRFLWDAKPLPEGDLRSCLEDMASRLRIRVREILVWNTHSVVGNAAVVGFFPHLRYVFLSDVLVHTLRERELEAVFAHEAGHLVHHHLFLRVLAILAPFGLLGLIDQLAPGIAIRIGASLATLGLAPAEQAAMAMLFGMALYVPFVFTGLSRWLETQADIFACRVLVANELEANQKQHAPLTLEGVALFTSALEKITALNGVSRTHAGMQHYSVAQRVRTLQEMAVHPELEQQFQSASTLGAKDHRDACVCRTCLATVEADLRGRD